MRIVKVLTVTVASAAVLSGIPAVQAAEAAKKKSPPSFSTTIKEGRKAVRAALKQTKSTSASIALVSNGKTVWSQTFGRVNASGKKPSSTTKYGMGSVSKMVTTMAVMQLVDAGKISLDAPVVRYVPDFSMQSPQYKQITVRMLLNHSAGLPGIDLSNSTSPQWIPGYVEGVMAGFRNSRLKTTPGAMNVYCNDCFTLAGVVVERVSGLPFQDYVAANILKPLGMKHSSYPTSVPAPGTVAPAIVGGKPLPWVTYNLFASGGLLSTAQDMARLAKVFTGDGVVGGTRILSSSAIQQMGMDQTTTTLRAGSPSEWRYGLGWDTVQDPALKSAGVLGWTKGGDASPYKSSFTIAPDQRLAVVVQIVGVDASFPGTRSVGQTVLLNALVETGAVKKMPKQVSGMPAKQKAKPQDIRRMTGTYLTSAAPQLKLTEAKERSLTLAQLSDGKWVKQPGRFELRKNGAFWSTETPGTSIRSVKAWGRQYLVKRSIGGTGTYSADMAIGQRTRSGGPLPPAWQARVGKAWLLANEDPNSQLWLVPGLQFAAIPGLSGYLLAQGSPVNSVPFDATTSDNAGTMSLEMPPVYGRDLFDFTFAQRNGEEFLSVSSSVLRPASTVPSLVSGSNAITIGSQGLVEWYKVPAASTVTMSGQSDWKLFDGDVSMIDSGGAAAATTQAPAGAYLVVFGPAGSTATVVVD